MSRTILIFAIIALYSCNENRVFEDHIDPSGNLEWNRDEVIKFDIEIIDISLKYNQFIAFRYALGYRYPTCEMEILEKRPDGSEETHIIQIKVMDDKGYLGDGSGDIFDIEVPWRKDFSFSTPGTYQYEIKHLMQDEKIHMVMEVGMILDRVKNEK